MELKNQSLREYSDKAKRPRVAYHLPWAFRDRFHPRCFETAHVSDSLTLALCNRTAPQSSWVVNALFGDTAVRPATPASVNRQFLSYLQTNGIFAKRKQVIRRVRGRHEGDTTAVDAM
ncbi:MAG: hypothetical protein M3Q32_02575, partial [Pseudomonadota bacterium]|nr:hypothetical protein [Pseudomonadota bacterium]